MSSNGQDNDARKIFVGGLGQDIQEEDLTEYFSKFGEVTQSIIKREPTSQLPRGFGFVTFAKEDTVREVLNGQEHYIKNKRVDPNKCHHRPQNQPEPPKVFIGGIDPQSTEEEVKEFFEKQNHKVAKVEWPWDKSRQQRKNFLFIQFETNSSVTNVLAAGEKQLVVGKMCDVRRGKPSAPKGAGSARPRNAYNMDYAGGVGAYDQYGSGGGSYDQYGGSGYGCWGDVNSGAYGNMAMAMYQYAQGNTGSGAQPYGTDAYSQQGAASYYNQAQQQPSSYDQWAWQGGTGDEASQEVAPPPANNSQGAPRGFQGSKPPRGSQGFHPYRRQ